MTMKAISTTSLYHIVAGTDTGRNWGFRREFSSLSNRPSSCLLPQSKMWSLVSGTSWQMLRLWLALIISVTPGVMAASKDKRTISGAPKGKTLLSSLGQ